MGWKCGATRCTMGEGKVKRGKGRRFEASERGGSPKRRWEGDGRGVERDQEMEIGKER